jgi:hypothetical protein
LLNHTGKFIFDNPAALLAIRFYLSTLSFLNLHPKFKAHELKNIEQAVFNSICYGAGGFAEPDAYQRASPVEFYTDSRHGAFQRGPIQG